MIQINGNCSGDPGDKPVTLSIDNGHSYPVQVDGNRWSAKIDKPEPSPFGAAINADGKQLARLTVPPPGSWEAEPAPVSMTPSSLSFAPPVPDVVKLSTSGRDFIVNGQRWIWKGTTDFRMYQWFLEGRNMTEVRQQRRAAGANILRVAGMYAGGIGDFRPAQYGQAYWDGWTPFLAECARDGFQVEITCFMDCQNIQELRDVGPQRDHWGRFGDIIRPVPNAVMELGNEYPQNGFDPKNFAPHAGVLCSRGSNIGDEPPVVPGWNYHTWHGRRDWPKVLFSAEDMWYVGEGWGPGGAYQYPVIPVVHDEPIGFSDVNQPGRRSNDPYVARVLGGSSSEFGAGVTFHCDYGIQSALWSDRMDLCARTMFAAAG